MSGPTGEHWLTDEKREEIRQRFRRRKKDKSGKKHRGRRKREGPTDGSEKRGASHR